MRDSKLAVGVRCAGKEEVKGWSLVGGCVFRISPLSVKAVPLLAHGMALESQRNAPTNPLLQVQGSICGSEVLISRRGVFKKWGMNQGIRALRDSN